MENTSHEFFFQNKVSILRELLYQIKRHTDGSYSIIFLGRWIPLKGKMNKKSVEQENGISFMYFI